MAMEDVLKKLENRINDLVTAHGNATARVAELEARVPELEAEVEKGSEVADKITALEAQRNDLATRLEAVLKNIDKALKGSGGS